MIVWTNIGDLNKIAKDICLLIFLRKNDASDNYTPDIYLWIVIYCFYMDYNTYNIQQKNENDDFHSKNTNIYNYINHRFEDCSVLKNICFNILYFISEIFIWLLFLGFFLTILLHSTNLIFGLQLVLIIIILNLYLKTLERKVKEEILTLVIKLTVILKIFSYMSTLALFVFQFSSLDLIKQYIFNIDELTTIEIGNLRLLGFELYETDKLLSSFTYIVLLNFFIAFIHHRLLSLFEIKLKPKSDVAKMELIKNSIILKYIYMIINFFLDYCWILVFLIIFVCSYLVNLSICGLYLNAIFLFKLIHYYNLLYQSKRKAILSEKIDSKESK